MVLRSYILELLRPETPRVRRLLVFSLVVMLCFCLIVFLQAVSSFNSAERQGKDDASRLTHILSDHVELTFLSVDLTLRRATERHYFNSLFGGNLPEYMQQNFVRWVSQLPQISAMVYLNKQGQVEAASYEKGFKWFLAASRSVIDENSFNNNPDEHYSGNDTSFRILTGGDGKQAIVMARSVNTLDGNFGGVVIAAISPDYFMNFFTSIAHAEHPFMSVLLNTGEPLVAGPMNDNQQKEILSYIIHDKDDQVATANNIQTRKEEVAERTLMLSYNRLSSFPISVAIAVDSEDYMSEWRSNQFKDTLFLTIFLLFGTALSLFAVTLEKQIRRVQQSESSAIAASQTKSEFLANMSHEFRTPLNAIIGFSEMMLSGYFGILSDKQKERINDINLCGTHLLQLINDILEFSKGEAGKLELREEWVNIPEVVEECVRIMREKTTKRHLNIQLYLDRTYIELYSDKRKVRQVLLNLLSNAVKFTPQEGTISIRSRVDEYHRFHLTVEDSGVGIAEQDIPKALSVFGQVHRSQSLEGTGLGLPLCKIFAELHDGELTLSSTLGIGTTVDITFPAVRVRT